MRKFTYLIALAVGLSLSATTACSSSKENDEPDEPVIEQEEEEEYQEVPTGSGWEDLDGFSRYFTNGGWFTFRFDAQGEAGVCQHSTFSRAFDRKKEAAEAAAQMKREGMPNVTQDGRIVSYDAPDYLGMTYADVRFSFGNVQEKQLAGYWMQHSIKTKFVAKNPEYNFTDVMYAKDDSIAKRLWVFYPEDLSYDMFRCDRDINGYYWMKMGYGNYKFEVWNWGARGWLSYDLYNPLVIGTPHETGFKANITTLNEDTMVTFGEYDDSQGHWETTTTYHRAKDYLVDIANKLH